MIDFERSLNVNLKKSCLFLIFLLDCLAICLASYTSYLLRFNDKNEVSFSSFFNVDYILVIFVVAFFWILYLVGSGVYRFSHANIIKFNLRIVTKKTFLYFFFLGFISFLFKISFSRFVFAYMLFFGFLYVSLFRTIFFLFVIKPWIQKKKITSKMLVVGRSHDEIKIYSDWIMSNRLLGFTISNRIVCKSINSFWIEEFDKLLSFSKITEVLLLPGMESDPNFSKFIHYCEDLSIHVNWIPLDSGNLGYWLIPTPQEGIPFLTFEKSELSLPWKIAKRTFDLVFSLTVMILLLPLFLAISLAVLMSSGWPIFYSQTRVGLHGKPFKFYKFRSMVKDADKLVGEIENLHENDHVIFKNKQDPRVTPVGRVLRKYSLDELPQFLNVFNNTMSVVGPRPALPREANVYNSIYERRLNAKPGITGPWQISGRSDLDLGTSVSLDLNYLINWSFSRDLWIIFATIGAVFKGKGAY